mmetsp:Transcript_6723/g.10093  ORF Transcript_6723/g.10093 Transcript_6723/m.10093 type:complete len:317 (-) Transcript_6723:98-1048(-)|eukprot:CAMPEP_0196231992 /NCGR_PEP_ID=MMETSP0913-20130531/2687_1 /TAXON_ID=49265 /ORGANISM="Thalassiosira rotula, Strain GSO102" /LENGTH=316 /DNA_ID=CAMNT_0041512321 /DNA_START=44 /DNA_END=994 /DNA_ORIENTATION=+
MSATTFISLALSLAISPAPFADAFSRSNAYIKHHLIVKYSSHHVSSTELKYRSLHHGPDVEPLSDMERQGADFTKMDKSQIRQYGPGDFAQYEDHHPSDFDGGDSEMGLSGDGNVGLQKFGRDISPHMAGTLTAKIDQAPVADSMSYTDGLLQSNPGMDAVRAQQLENWATQKEIATANRYMNEVAQTYQDGLSTDNEYHYNFEDPASFSFPVEVGEEVEGIITLRSAIYGVAVQEIMLKNPYMGHAVFRAAFVGDQHNEWSVTPNDGFLKQNEATHFVVRFNPYSPGLSHCHLVIETEDFKKTWKVVGSTGEYDF